MLPAPKTALCDRRLRTAIAWVMAVSFYAIGASAQGLRYDNVLQSTTTLSSGVSVTLPSQGVSVTACYTSTISSLTETGTVVTVTTAAVHGLQVGQAIKIVGVGVVGYNGTFTVSNTPTSTTFTYINSTPSLGASSGGTVLPNNIPCTPVATVYADQSLTTTAANPTTTDSLGNYGFWMAPGTYIFSLSGAGIAPSLYTVTEQPNGVDTVSNQTIGGSKIFSGSLTASNPCAIDGVIFISPGGCYSTIQAAYNALPSTGGWIILPPGTTTISSTISLAKPVHIMGGGYTSPLSTSLAPTVVNCTGTGPAFSITTSNASQSVIEGFNLINTGSCSIGVDLESNTVGDGDVSGVILQNLYIGSFTTAGVDIGGNSTVHLTINTILRNVYEANNPINFIVGFASTTLFDHVLAFNYTIADMQIGDSTHKAYKTSIVNQSDLEPNNILNTDVVIINNAEQVDFIGDYFETDGTGYGIDVPNTATSATSINVTDCRFIGAGVSTASQWAMRTALSTATWNIHGNWFTRYTVASSGIILNTAAQSIVFTGNVTDTGITNLASAPGTGIVTSAGNILNGQQTGPRFQSTVANPFIIEGPGSLQLAGTGLSFSTTPLLLTAAPTISSGFGTSPSIVNSNGSAVFTLNVGTGGTATSGVLTMPAAQTGWVCHADDMNTPTKTTTETAYTTTSVTLTTASAWTASDKLLINCGAF